MDLDVINFPDIVLKELISNLGSSSPFYRGHFEDSDFNWTNFQNYDDFRSLSYLEQVQVKQHSSDFRCSTIQSNRIYCSGGTIGQPKSIYYTEEDWKKSIEANIKCLKIANVNSRDIVAILQPFDIWSIGSVFLDSVSKLGAMALPLGISLDDADVRNLLQRHKVTIIMAAPGNMCRLTDKIAKEDRKIFDNFRLRKLILSGENCSDSQKEYLSDHWSSEVISLYGSAETDSIGIECINCRSHRLLYDEFFFELLTENGAELLRPGLTGELIVTTLHRQGTPLVRYKLGDIVNVLPHCGKCKDMCPTVQIVGRSSPTFALNDGTKLYDYQVKQAIESAIHAPFSCQVTRSGENRDSLLFTIFCKKEKADLEEQIKNNLQRTSVDFSHSIAAGFITIEIDFRELSEIPLNQRGKVITFIDSGAAPL